MPRRRLWALTSLFFLLAPALAAEVHADFSFYPVGAQSCLSQAATTSKCDGNTVMDLNTCLCGNWGNFVILAAICIGKNDKADAVPVYKTMVSACADSNTPLNVAPNVFYGAVNGQVTTTTSAATTMTTSTTTTNSATTTTATATTATSTSTSTAAPVSENLSTGATIGIALGASFGGVGAIAGLVYYLLRRSKNQGEEYNPMLLPNSNEEARFSNQPPLSEPTPSPGIASTFSEAKRASWVSPLQSPDPYRYSAATWDATQGAYKGPYAPPEGAVELPPQTASVASSTSGMVFEMDATTSQQSSGPVEIQGDVPPFTDHGRR